MLSDLFPSSVIHFFTSSLTALALIQAQTMRVKRTALHCGKQVLCVDHRSLDTHAALVQLNPLESSAVDQYGGEVIVVIQAISIMRVQHG